MRAQARRRGVEEEEESSFVSMTDMTVSFLFIVMILLAFFASQLHNKDAVPRQDFDRVLNERDAALLENQALLKQLEAIQEQLDEVKSVAASLSALVASLKDELSQKDQAIAAAEQQIRDKDAELSSLKQQIASLLEEITQLKIKDPLEDYLKQVAEQRSEMLNQLQSRLKADFPDLQVIVSAEMDALRFKGDGLFSFNSSELPSAKRRIIEALADRLEDVLPCYTLGSRSQWKDACNPVGAVIEAVQIEGHTDGDGPDNTNLTLSTGRANATFFAMTMRQPSLTAHLNTQEQPVLSVAGYGEMRPVTDNASAEGKATNRRIDLRIIMYTPRSLEDIERVKTALRKGVQEAPAP